MMARALAVLALLFGLLAPARADLIAVPALKARVTDQTATLSAAAKGALEARLADLEKRKGSQLAVLILPTTGEETIEQFGIRVAEVWKLGRKGIDDGLLLLIAKDDRSLRIEVGYGLEGAVPDAVAKRVIEEIIVPRFKAGDFEGGVGAGVDSLIKLVEGEPLPEPASSRSSGWASFEEVLPLALMFIFVAGGLLRAIFGPLPGAAIAGGVAFAGAWLLAGAFLVAVAVALAVFFLTLIGVAGVGGGRGGGGGGFSGGGGGFGGGGASGRW